MIRSAAHFLTLPVCLSLFPATSASAGNFLIQAASPAGVAQSSVPGSDSSIAAPLPPFGKNRDVLPTGWKFYRSPDGQFTARFPATPEVTSEKMSGKVVKMVFSSTYVATYMLIYMDLKPAFSRDMNNQALVRAANGASRHGKLVSNTTVSFHGYPAREVVLDKQVAAGLALCDDLMFIVNKRFYQILTVITRNTDNPVNTRVFQRSFKLVGNR